MSWYLIASTWLQDRKGHSVGLCIGTDIFRYIGRPDIYFISGSRADIFADILAYGFLQSRKAYIVGK